MMNKAEKIRILQDAIDGGEYVEIYFKNDRVPYYGFPFAVSDRLFICADEVDFLVDGFSIFKLIDIADITVQDDHYADILRSENTRGTVVMPDICIDRWQDVFRYLLDSQEVAFVNSYHELDVGTTATGKTTACNDNVFAFKSYDRDGEALDFIVRYTDVMEVSFGSHYHKVLAKYT